MEGGDQWYPLYKGNDCVGQLLIGATFDEGAKYTSQHNKNWEAVDDISEEEEEEDESYDLTQAMLIPAATKNDPKGANKLAAALAPAPKLKAPKMSAPKLSGPKLEGPKMAKKVGCW
jgi:hypothetical protein